MIGKITMRHFEVCNQAEHMNECSIMQVLQFCTFLAATRSSHITIAYHRLCYPFGYLLSIPVSCGFAAFFCVIPQKKINSQATVVFRLDLRQHKSPTQRGIIFPFISLLRQGNVRWDARERSKIKTSRGCCFFKQP